MPDDTKLNTLYYNNTTPEGSYTAAAIGNNVEQTVVSLLSLVDCVAKVDRDTFNSAYDIYFRLEGEEIYRGLQVKALGKRGRGYAAQHRVRGNWTVNKELWFDDNKAPNFTVENPQPSNKVGDGPEGPEVTHVAHQLHALLGDGQTRLISISFVSGRYAKTPFKGYKMHLAPHLPQTVRAVQNKGKYLSFHLDGDIYVGNSFGLTGLWQLYDPRASDERKVRMLFNFINLATNELIIVAYFDSIGYGYFTAFPTKKAHLKKLTTLGPSLPDATLAHYYAKFQAHQKRKPKQCLVEFMMKQAVVSGMGNYLKCDVLHALHMSPHVTLGHLNVSNVTCLFNMSQQLYRESLYAGGSPHYRDLYGQKGEYEFKVYEDKSATKVKTADKRMTYTKWL